MQHGVLGSYEGDGDDTILYMEPVFGDPKDHCFAHYSNAGDGVSRPWMFFHQTLLVPDSRGVNHPQYFEIEVCMLREDEFVPPDPELDIEEEQMLVRLKGRFSRFRFGRCKFHVVAACEARGKLGLYFPMGFTDERVDWVSANTTGAWSMRVFQPQNSGQRFALEFSFSNERDAVLFKTWWCG